VHYAECIPAVGAFRGIGAARFGMAQMFTFLQNATNALITQRKQKFGFLLLLAPTTTDFRTKIQLFTRIGTLGTVASSRAICHAIPLRCRAFDIEAVHNTRR